MVLFLNRLVFPIWDGYISRVQTSRLPLSLWVTRWGYELIMQRAKQPYRAAVLQVR